MVNGPDQIFIEKQGRLEPYPKKFLSKEKLEDVIQQIVGKVNRTVNESSPIVDVRLQDGSRVNVVLPPVAINGPIVTIRKFPADPITMEHLVSIQSITMQAGNFRIVTIGPLIATGGNTTLKIGRASCRERVC